MTAKDMTGQRFGRLAVLGRAPNGRGRQAHWLCRCDCGVELVANGSNLRRENTKSCGCLQSEWAKKNKAIHRMSKTKIYRIWSSMIERCQSPTCPTFEHYGGRGITVCQRWRDSFSAFYQDVGDPPPKYTLERIDNDGHYEPGNVRWATRKEQARNRRGNHLITFNGETKCIAEWAEIYNIPQRRLFARLDAGWDVLSALTKPPKPY